MKTQPLKFLSPPVSLYRLLRHLKPSHRHQMRHQMSLNNLIVLVVVMVALDLEFVQMLWKFRQKLMTLLLSPLMMLHCHPHRL